MERLQQVMPLLTTNMTDAITLAVNAELRKLLKWFWGAKDFEQNRMPVSLAGSKRGALFPCTPPASHSPLTPCEVLGCVCSMMRPEASAWVTCVGAVDGFAVVSGVGDALCGGPGPEGGYTQGVGEAGDLGLRRIEIPPAGDGSQPGESFYDCMSDRSPCQCHQQSPQRILLLVAYLRVRKKPRQTFSARNRDVGMAETMLKPREELGAALRAGPWAETSRTKVTAF
ncbi:hypothetical protein BDK51DRAFT_37771 [Blyttiomyces helicus]|uniref:Uncharacterized protein n=1 Tax=Blyttiomyces helicus TaxID=388810 RepID=A0A4P9WIM4_9FUNG|nr:hypothetical protein BDK51DRAFT_37771 [Blyttiomyces helicus]|eukprot:RKO92272.1 hypothetical protein BDK51DRAFT_37771 [Blyttiomyces helicus]